MFLLASVFRSLSPFKISIWCDHSTTKMITSSRRIFIMFLLASLFRSFTPQNKHMVWSFNIETDHCIEAHFFYLFMFIWQFTPWNNHIVWSFNNENDHWSRRICFFFVFFFYVSLGFSISIAYPSNKGLAVVIQQRKWSLHRGAYFLLLGVVIQQRKWSLHRGTSFLFVCVSFGFSISIVYPSK